MKRVSLSSPSRHRNDIFQQVFIADGKRNRIIFSMKNKTPISKVVSANIETAQISIPKKPHLATRIYITLCIVSIILMSYLGYQHWQLKKLSTMPTTYDECIHTKDSKILESYPETCVTADGKRFIHPLTDEKKQNLLPPNDSTNR